MPDSLHPPFVPGAITTPRQLQKWLDINPQGGPLKRTQNFLTIPLFSVYAYPILPSFSFDQCSDIACTFNCEATNNFSLKLGDIYNSDPDTYAQDYMLCIMWMEDDGNTVVRYKIARPETGFEFSIDWPQYTGQLIKKNFRFEVWAPVNSPDVTPAGLLITQPTPITLYTSVRGDQDYRWGIDSVLSGFDPIVTVLYALKVVIPGPALGWLLPIVFPSNSIPVTN